MTVVVSPGRPANFEYDLRDIPTDLWPEEVHLLREYNDGEGTRFLNWGAIESVDDTGVVYITNLSKGRYLIMARTNDYIEIYPEPFLNDWRRIEIVSGVTNRFRANPPLVDTSIKPDDGSVTGLLQDSSGKPLQGKAIYLLPFGAKEPYRDETTNFYYFYPKQNTDENGRFRFVGVNPSYNYQLEYRESDSRTHRASHDIYGRDLNVRKPLEISLVAH